VQCDEALVSHIAQALVSWPEERRRAFVDCLDDVRDALRPEAARAA
jgi:hypothetical protein